jgi:hypothetical protein
MNADGVSRKKTTPFPQGKRNNSAPAPASIYELLFYNLSIDKLIVKRSLPVEKSPVLRQWRAALLASPFIDIRVFYSSQ